MAGIGLEDVTKRFAADVVAVDSVSLEIEDGEFVVLVGPSGCGKSTLLRMIAGLEEPTEGRVWIGDRDVTREAPKDRDIAMVFQNYALYPHMSVRDNLAFGLKLRSTPEPERNTRVGAAARVLGLDKLLARKPAALSGGQRQRVAMGRAMVREPRAFLMDEPLSNLDASLRVQMRGELARLRDRLKTTTVYVTHDQVEAMTLGDRVAVLCNGRLQQVASPKELFKRPANLFVAAFIGSPAMNLVEATVRDGIAEFATHRLPLAGRPEARALEGERVILGIRPTAFAPARTAPGRPTLEIVPDIVEDLGDETNVLFGIEAPPVDTDDLRAAAEGSEDAVLVHDETKRSVFVARLHGETGVRVGERIPLAVDVPSLHLFDPRTGHPVHDTSPVA